VKLYGTATYFKAIKAWEIECQPHVSIRLKRWLPKIDSTHYGKKHRLKATPENCLDLQVFLQRYPMDVRPSERFLEERASEHKERMSLVDKFLRGEGNDKVFPLKLPPREYQGLAANMWMTTGGLLLADDVGLGKTCVAFCGFVDPKLRPALVVTLSHLPMQWASELEKFTDLRCHILKKGTPYDILDKQGRLPDVIISNYHKLGGWATTLEGVVKSITFDECQELRHRGTQKYEAAKLIADSVDFRLGLSATPIYNYGGEIWNVCDVITPDSLGTWEEFSREWCEFKGQKYVIPDPAAFGVYARESGVMLRRTRKEVKRELPGVIRVPQWIQSDPEAFKKLKGQAIELAKLILSQNQQQFKGQKMQAAGEFDMKMRQMTGIAKAPYVADFVRFLVEENGTPVVLYGWHRDVYEIWLEKLRGSTTYPFNVANLNPVMYTGTESPAQKEWAKQEFLSGRSKVMIISLRAGQGMDGLQEVCHVDVFGELDWSPGVHEQCEGRLHRDGQDEPVTSYYLLADDGSDPVMSDVLGVKTQQIEGILDPNRDLVTQLQTDPNHIRKLAEKYLTDHGVPLPQPEPKEIQEEVL
jgi:SNF2 family DNA or RNA helicase